MKSILNTRILRTLLATLAAAFLAGCATTPPDHNAYVEGRTHDLETGTRDKGQPTGNTRP